MLRFDIHGSHSGQVFEASAGPAELIAFEATFDRSVVKIQDELRFTDLAFLAWHALKRSKKTTTEFSEWVNDLEDLDLKEVKETAPLGDTANIG